MGVRIVEANTGTRYDYSVDDRWKDYTTKAKEREKLLKQIAISGETMYDEDGVEITPPPVKSYGVSTIKCTIPKS